MKGNVTRQEILSQPEVWEACLAGSWPNDAALAQRIQSADFDRILLVGCGSSYYLALTLAAYLRRAAGVRTAAVPAGEAWLHPHLDLDHGEQMLAICISRSGRTSEVLRARERLAGEYSVETVALTCYPESPLAESCDHLLSVEVAQEASVVMTRSFTGLYVRLARIFESDSLRRLPPLARALICEHGTRLSSLGVRLDLQRFVFLGSGALYGFAREAALKVGEMSLAPAVAYHTLEFRHGPIATASAGTLLVLWLTDVGREHEVRVAEEVCSLGAEAVVLGGTGPHDVPLEGEGEALAAMPLIHLLALGRGLAAGQDPDHPRVLGHVVEI